MDIDFEKLVEEYYQGLYRFAMSLAKNEPDATDLTQQTFYRFATKGHQIKDASKVKTWLFTTLYREFLGTARRAKKFKHIEMEDAGADLPNISSKAVRDADAGLAMEALKRVEEKYRVPLALFYIQDQSYKEIAKLMEIPIGTVMSRLSRGKEQLRHLLSETINSNHVTS